MFIEIDDLDPEPLHVQHVFPMGDIAFSREDAALGSPVTVDFVLDHKGRDLHINGTVLTAIQLRCSRCNDEITREFSTGFELSYLPQPEYQDDEEVELKYEDMDVAFYDGIALDVNLMVLEQIELAIPMKFVCREDCKGLCFQCGTNLNEGTCSCERNKINDRMGALIEFRKKMDI